MGLQRSIFSNLGSVRFNSGTNIWPCFSQNITIFDRALQPLSDNDPHITNPRSLGYMIWTRIPDNRLEINFETDEQIHSSGFTLEWRCAAEDSGNKCSDADFNANVIRAIFDAFEADKHKFTKSKGNKASG